MPHQSRTGAHGERSACAYLRHIGYRVDAMNVYTRWGEIDIVAYDTKAREYVFVEVKTRRSYTFGTPEEAFTEVKKQRLVRAVRYFCIRNNISEGRCRIDFIGVDIGNAFRPSLRHYKGVEVV